MCWKLSSMYCVVLPDPPLIYHGGSRLFPRKLWMRWTTSSTWPPLYILRVQFVKLMSPHNTRTVQANVKRRVLLRAVGHPDSRTPIYVSTSTQCRASHQRQRLQPGGCRTTIRNKQITADDNLILPGSYLQRPNNASQCKIYSICPPSFPPICWMANQHGYESTMNGLASRTGGSIKS